MKNQVKKICIVITILLLFVSCSNSNNTNTSINQSSLQQKESFYENKMVKLFNSFEGYNFPNNEDYYSKNEYKTLDELMGNAFSFETWEGFKKQKERYKKVEKFIKEVEGISKSNFFLLKGQYGEIERIFFTPKESTGYDFCEIVVNSSLDLSGKIYKISLKEYINSVGLWLLHEDMKEGVDIKSLGLDPATTEKLLEAQNYKGN